MAWRHEGKEKGFVLERTRDEMRDHTVVASQLERRHEDEGAGKFLVTSYDRYPGDGHEEFSKDGNGEREREILEMTTSILLGKG